MNWAGGDLFVVAGQSNAEGAGTTQNSYVHSGTILALLKRPNVIWTDLVDPTSDLYNNNGGSVWPVVGQSYLTTRSLPVAFVTTAEGASATQNWLPGTAFYNAMIARANYAVGLNPGGTLKAVCWWQGESDGLAGVSQATYHANLASIAAGIGTDLGIPLIVAKLQNCTGISAANLLAIQNAQVAAWGDIPNVRQGPDLSDITTDDGLHLVTNVKVQLAASRWWDAIKLVFGW